MLPCAVTTRLPAIHTVGPSTWLYIVMTHGDDDDGVDGDDVGDDDEADEDNIAKLRIVYWECNYF